MYYHRYDQYQKERKMSENTEPKTVLSPKVQQLLEDLCDEFGSTEDARRDPEFVLQTLLEVLNNDKGDVSAMVRLTLDSGISAGSLEDRRSFPEEYLPKKEMKS